MSQGWCEGHPELADDLRGLAVAVLDRIEPAIHRLRAEPPSPAPSSCALCPVCALIATLRGERPEAAGRIAEHAGGLVAALRVALAQPPSSGPPSSGPPSSGPPPTPARKVQHIRVTRPGDGAARC